jgi:hypothetical protein
MQSANIRQIKAALVERGCPVPLGPSLRSDAARASFWL